MYSNLIDSLSRRENECLKLTSKGYNNCQISKIMGIRKKTVEKYLSSIYEKLYINCKIWNPRVYAIIKYKESNNNGSKPGN